MSREHVNTQKSMYSILQWLFSQKSAYLNDESDYVFGMFGRLIHASLESTEPKGQSLRNVLIRAYTPDFLTKSIVEVLSEREGDFVTVFGHGSAFDGTALRNWSDVDVVAIVKDEVFADGARLKKLRECILRAEEEILKIDPWQHHGIQAMTELDLEFYPESWLPAVVWNEGRVLVGAREIELKLRDCAPDLAGRWWSWQKLFARAVIDGCLDHHCKGGVCLQSEWRNADVAFYQFKYFVSVVLMMPSAWLQFVGQPVYKAESFELMKNYFSEAELELVWACERVRALAPIAWKDDEQFRSGLVPQVMRDALGSNYLERASNLVNIMAERAQIYANKDAATTH